MTGKKVIFTITLFALLLRIGFFIPAISSKPVFDERTYFERSIGLSNIVGNFIGGQSVQESDINLFYGPDPFTGGWWPPLQMVLISISRLLPFNSDLVVKARLLTLLLSTLTVPLVYLVSSTAFGRRSSYVASFLFATYPSFIAFSHYLWSETLFIFLLFSTIYFAFSLVHATSRHKKLQTAGLTGLFLGLSALTRTTTLPFFFHVPLWLFLAQIFHRTQAPFKKELPETTLTRRQKNVIVHLISPIVVILIAVIVISPWEMVLYLKEGHLAPLSTSGGYNFYVGTSPTFITREEAEARIREFSEATGLHRDAAARELGIKYIRENPGLFRAATADKLRRPWAGDLFIFRHLFQVIYPPFSPTIALWVIVVVYVCFTLLLATSVVGIIAALFERMGHPFPSTNIFFRPLRWFSTNRGFLISAIALLFLFTLIGIPNARTVLPVIALLTIFSAHGIYVLLFSKGPKLLLLSLIGVLLALVIIQNIQIVNRRHPDLHPSSYYHQVIEKMGPYLRTVYYNDRVTLYDQSEQDRSYTISVLSENYELVASEAREAEWHSSILEPTSSMEFRSRNPTIPLMLRLVELKTNQSVTIEPIHVEAWHKWMPTGIDGLFYRWETRAR